MGGTRYNGRQRGRSSRFEVIALLLGLALIVSQAIGVVTAAADGKGPSGLSSLPGSTKISTKDSATKAGPSSTSTGATKATTAKTATDTTKLAPAAPPSSGANISVDFIAAGPGTYNHTTGNGTGNLPRYGDRHISKTTGVVESLEGGDFKCGDLVVFFTKIDVESGSGSRDATMNLAFTKEPTGQPGAGFDDIVSAQLSANDSLAGGANAGLDGDETVTLTNENDNAHFQGKDFVTGDVVVTNLNPGESLVVKVVAHLGCLVGSSPTGNLQALVNDESSSNNADTFNIGQQTIPFKKVEDIAQPGINIVKTADDATVQAGDPIGFTITVSNDGNVALSNVSVSDPLPTGPGVSWIVAGTSGDTAGLSCSISSNTLTCTKSSLSAGGSFTVHVTSPTTGDSCKTYDNTATVTSGPLTDSSSDSVVVEGCNVDLTLDKSADVTSVNAGDSFTYTIDVSNTGNATATNVHVTDSLPAGVTIDGATFTGGSNGPGTCDVSGQNVDCDLGSLAGGATAQVTIDVTVDASACPSVTNDASVSADNETGSTDDNSDSVTVDVNCSVNLTLDKSADAQAVNAGDGVTFTIDVANDGQAAATNVHVTDSMPAGVTIDSATFTGGSNGPGTCDVTGQNIDCDLGTLAAGASAKVTIDVTVDASNCPSITNNASVSADNETGSTEDNSDSVTVGVSCSVNVSLDKSADAATVEAGGKFTYTIDVASDGQADATNVHVTDTMPAGLTIDSATFTGGSNGPGTCDVSGQDIDCDLGTLAAGQTAQVTIAVTADAGACPSVTNDASVSADNETGSTEDNSDSVTVDVTCAVSVTVDKTNDANGDESFNDSEQAGATGQAVDFKVVVTNTSEVPVTITSLTDAWPGQDPFDLQCDGAEGSFNPVGTVLDPGESLTCFFTVPDYAPAAGTSLTDTVVVAVSSNSGGAGDSDDSTVSVAAPPPPPAPLGIQIIKSGPALAHVGDTIKYTFDVSLTTSTPLTNITVSDPKCSATPTLDSKSGGDQDTTLEPGETWHYSCTHVVTASDTDPLPNTATASGTDSQGRNTSDTDDHLVDIIHPAIKIVKTANPLSIAPGETVTYTYRVTNIGDVTLYNVSVDDDKLGHICDIAQLDVDETQTCTKDFTAREDNLGPLKNVAVAAGEDETGYPVRDDDKASIDVVLGTTVTPTTTPPSGTAFTGSTVLPLGAIALVLLIVGTGLIYMGRRREDGSQA